MPRNKHYHDDVLYLTQPTRNILLTLGAWPSISERSITSKIYNLLLICISYILLSCEIIPILLYWLREKSIRPRLQLIPSLLYDFMSVGQYSIFVFRYSQLRQCLKHVEEDWQNAFNMNTRNIMLKFAKRGKRLVTICGLLMYSNVLFFRTIVPLLQGRIVINENTTIRALACPVYLFSLDVQVSPVYETVFLTQNLTGFITVSIAICTCGFTAIFVVHACGQLKILIDLMRSLVQKQWQEEREVDKKLAKIVEHHVRIRSLLRLVQNTLQETYLMEIIVNTITICLLVYFVIVDWESSNMAVTGIYLLSIINVTIHIFLFCYTGEQLTIQAEKVAIASCDLEWYRLPDRKVRSVVLLMIMSNTPCKISVGKVIDLSFETFGYVMKTAGAYFNVLRNVIE